MYVEISRWWSFTKGQQVGVMNTKATKLVDFSCRVMLTFLSKHTLSLPAVKVIHSLFIIRLQRTANHTLFDLLKDLHLVSKSTTHSYTLTHCNTLE